MKKAILLFTLIVPILVGSAIGQTPDKEPVRIDKILEADAKHNLDVAWQYFKLRKAYQAVLMRTDETLAAHPNFSKIDEVIYLTGMSSYYLSIGKGKQNLSRIKLTEAEKERFEPKRLKEDAIAFLGTLVEKYPKSKYRKKAAKVLKEISPPKK